MRNYETARKLFSFLEFLAWVVVVIGLMVAIYGAEEAPRNAGLLFASPGLLMGILGLILVAMVQSSRASVDTAEYTQQMLQNSRDQLEVSRQSLRQSRGAAVPTFGQSTKKAPGGAAGSENSIVDSKEADGPSYGDIAEKRTPDAAPDLDDFTYRGRYIRAAAGLYFYDGVKYEDMDSVKAHIDEISGPRSIDSEVPMLEERRAVPSDIAIAAEEPVPAAFEANVVLGLNDGVLEYEGQKITVKNGIFFVGERKFETLAGAHNFINPDA